MLLFTLLGCLGFFSSLGFGSPVDGSFPCEHCTCSKSERWDGTFADCSAKSFENIPHVQLPEKSPVVHLDLSSNRIQFQAGQLCTLYPQLKSVSLAQNSLTSLGSLFAGCQSLVEVNLAGNSLKSVGTPALQSISTVESLVIEVDYLDSVDTLRQLKQLRKLNLTYHALSIDAGLFEGMKQLEELNLELTKCGTIANETFYVPSLKKLGLSGSKVKSMSTEFMSKLGSLTTLTFDLPKYPRLTVDLDGYSSKLKSLTVKDVRDVRSLANMTSLEILHVQGVEILSGDEDMFAGLENLKTLDLIDCSLYRIKPNWFTQLPALVDLDLSYNNFDFLQGSFFEGLNLQNLNLRKNKLTKITGDAFAPIKGSLQFLKLQENLLETIHADTFKGLENMMFLDLSQNFIEKIAPTAFDSMPQLILIHLQENLLSDSDLDDDLFSSLPQLQELDLSGNTFTQIPEAVIKTSISSLQMNQNRVLKVEAEAVCQMNRLDKLGLLDNPIVCNCSEQERQDCLTDGRVQVQGICTAPENLRDQSIVDFDCTQPTTPSTLLLVVPGPDADSDSPAEQAQDPTVEINHEITRSLEQADDLQQSGSLEKTNKEAEEARDERPVEFEIVSTGNASSELSPLPVNLTLPGSPASLGNEDNQVSSIGDSRETQVVTISTESRERTNTTENVAAPPLPELSEHARDEPVGMQQLLGERDHHNVTGSSLNRSQELLGHKNETAVELWLINRVFASNESLGNATDGQVNVSTIQEQKQLGKAGRPDARHGPMIAVILVIVIVGVAVLVVVSLIVMRNRQAGYYHTFRHAAFRAEEPTEIQMQTFESTQMQ